MVIAYVLITIFLSCKTNNGDIKNRPVNNSVVDTSSNISIYSIPLNTLDGRPFDLSALRNKKILIVNSASKCGYATQYEELQQLHERYGNSIAILSFPCNDFGDQEFGRESEIAEFCTKNYGVTFQLCEKVHVKGNQQHALYKWLTDASKNGWNNEAPTWNFCKYLISEKGELLHYFGSSVKPMSPVMLQAINNNR